MPKIYLDNAATTPVRKEVLDAMRPFFSKRFGNASSLHKWGQEAKIALENSRCTVAAAIGAEPEEIIFTSGGTESNNLALKGIVLANKGKHIITSAIEHPSVLQTAKWLEKQGVEVTYVPVDKQGIIRLSDLEKAIRKDTVLVSIMFANNEIGTVQPVKEIGDICKKKGVIFHTDAVQAFGKLPIDVKKMNIDLLSISSHKINGPKGVGALYLRKGTKIEPTMHGGGHEKNRRSGTENVAGIVGFAKAAELAKKELKQMKDMEKLRDMLIKGCLKVKDSRLNGHQKKRLPNNVNITFRYIEGEALVLLLDDLGIAASTGSACSTKKLEPSHVLLAIGLKHAEAHGSLRLTLGKDTKRSDVQYVLKVLPKTVKKLRKISPFKGQWEISWKMEHMLHKHVGD
ncbi:MAG: cysteine desulfurase NifS [Candidatus Aenigmatarchaeota archaeon]